MSDNSVYETDYKGYHIIIEQDIDLFESPRGWENLGTMVCWHRNYTLGDEQPKDDPIEFMQSLLADNYAKEIEQSKDCIEWMKSVYSFGFVDDDVYTFISNRLQSQTIELFEKYYYVLPIYAYEHSGITISTNRNGYPFNDRWDSGQLGFIFVDKEEARKEYKGIYGDDEILDLLEMEVRIYDDYLTGNVYGYMIYEIQEDGEYDRMDSIESCWGYYPDYQLGKYHEYCLDEAKDVVDCLATSRDEKLWSSIDEGEI